MPEAKRVEVIRGIPSLKHVRIWWDFTLSYWLNVPRMASACAQKAFLSCVFTRDHSLGGGNWSWMVAIAPRSSDEILHYVIMLLYYTFLWAEEVSHFVVRRKCSNERVVCCYGYWMAQAGWQAREGQRENKRDLECILYVFCCDWATR